MMRAFLTERLGGRAVRHPRATILIWLVAATAGGAAFLLGSGVLSASDDFLTTPESKQVEQLVADHLPGSAADTEVVVVRSSEHAVGDPDGAFLGRLAELGTRIRSTGSEDISSVVSIADVMDSSPEVRGESGGGGPAEGEATAKLVSDDGRTALILVKLTGSASEAQEHFGPLYDLVLEEDGRDGFDVSVTGLPPGSTRRRSSPSRICAAANSSASPSP